MEGNSMERSAGYRNDLSEEMSFRDLIFKVRDLLKYIASYWKVIFIIMLIGLLIGIMYAYNKKPLYTATTTFVLEETGSQGGLGQYAGIASMVGVDIGGGSGDIFHGDNIMELYKSRNMIQRALLSPTKKGRLLVDDYLDITKFKENQKEENLKRISFTIGKPFSRTQDSVLGKIVNDINQSYLRVNKLDKKLSIIEVNVTSRNEAFSKNFCDQIVETVNDFYIQTKTKKSFDNMSILQHQTDSVRKVLSGVIYNSIAVADATPNLNPARQILRVPIQQSQFNAEANKAILVQLVQNLELAKITLRKETPLIQVLDNPTLPVPVEKLGMLKGGIIASFALGFVTIAILILKWIFQGLMLQL